MHDLAERLAVLGFQAFIDFRLEDEGAGDGPFIASWLTSQPQPTPAQLEAAVPPPPRRLIRKTLVKQRLIDLGLMDAAFGVLVSQPVCFARWFDMDYPEVYADDPDALALLEAIGADPAQVMAP